MMMAHAKVAQTFQVLLLSVDIAHLPCQLAHSRTADLAGLWPVWRQCSGSLLASVGPSQIGDAAVAALACASAA